MTLVAQRGRVALFALLGVLMGAAGCGTVGSPLGGAKDSRGPELLRAVPATESVRVRPEKVEFAFDEFLRAQDVQKGVFIAPPPPGKRPQIYVAGRTLVVRLDAERLEDRTYVITLGQGIKDFTEGNPLPRTLQYAFTPGERLDTQSLSGRVLHPQTQAPAIGFIVALFDPDSVARRGLLGLAPVMASQTDSLGYYQISYLRPGRYVAFGFDDKDNSFTWNQSGEAVAQDPDSLVEISADAANSGWDLEWFVNDTLAPRLRGTEVLNRRSVRVELSEPVLAGRVVIGRDTFNLEPAAEHLYATPKRDVLQLFLRDALADSFRVQLSGLADSVGNVMVKDSTLMVRLRARGKFKGELELTPLAERENPFEVALAVNSPIAQDSAEKYISLIDSGRTEILGLQVRSLGGQLLLTLPAGLNPEIGYRVVVDTLLQSLDSLRPARRQRFTVKVPPADKFGSFTLRLRTTVPNALLQLTNDETGATRLLRGPRHELPYLPPGTYRVSVIEDADGNGRWTPGRVQPRRLSERVYHFPNRVPIRGGWSQELELSYPDPAAKPTDG